MDALLTLIATYVWIVNGVKGGVAKSSTSLLLLYHLQTLGVPVLLIELDSSNPDVAAASGLVDRETCFRLDVTLEAAWDTVADIIEAHPGHAIVINLPAQSERAVSNNLVPLIGAGFGAKFHTVWALGPTRDSTLALDRYLALQTGEPVYVMRAAFMVDDIADFEAFDELRHRELRRLGVDPNSSAASGAFENSYLRGGAVLDHLRSPYQMRALMFDGKDITGSIVRFSIAKIVNEGPKFARARTQLFIQKMTPALAVLTKSVHMKG